MNREFLLSLGLAEDVIAAILEHSDETQRQHEKELADVRFEALLERAISRFGGRSSKAICALLDIDAISASDDPAAAADEALAALKRQNAYLFEAPAVPSYAPGPGTAPLEPDLPLTLAEALKQRFA